MACTINAVNFVDSNDNLFSGCTATPGSVNIRLSVTFDVATNAYLYFEISTPTGEHDYYIGGGSGRLITFTTSGTYIMHLTGADGLDTSTPGNYSIIGVLVVDENKYGPICAVTNYPINDCMTLTVTGGGGGGQTLGNISISPNASVGIGKTAALSATCTSTSGNSMTCPSLNWISSNPNVATVSNGVITGIALGNATITAIDPATNILSNPCGVTVTSSGGGGGGGGAGYSCSGAPKFTCTSVTTNAQYSTQTACQNACHCNSNTDCGQGNMCLFGGCYPQTYLIGALGIFALIMLGR